MLCAAMAELAANYKGIWAGIKAGFVDLYNVIRRRPKSTESSIYDPMGPADQVPIWVGYPVFNLTIDLGFRRLGINRGKLCFAEMAV